MKKWDKVEGKYTITPEYAQYLFSLGGQAESKDDIVSLMREHGESPSIVCCLWGGFRKAKGKWNTDFTTEEKTWKRIGEPTYDTFYEDWSCSRNFAEQKNESGVSVMDDNWGNTVSGMFIKTQAESRGIYEMKGIQVAWGSDGEPLIVITSLPVRVKD